MSSKSNTAAYLVNMEREVVHQWAVPFSKVWPNPTHVSAGVNDNLVCFFGLHLYPNGDLLVVFHGLDQLGQGCGLAKLDKDSNILWAYPANVHHDVDVAEDGTIYATTQKLVDKLPKGMEHIPVPYLTDYLVVLSSDGKELKEPLPLLQAFQESPYAPLLCLLERPGKDPRYMGQTLERYDQDIQARDLLHTNSVKVLTKALAPKFPQFKAGQVLISIRHLDTIAVLDIESRSVVWATRSTWQAQHDAQFLDNGHLLIFDNRGSPEGSRVLEYDPKTSAFPWSYPGSKGMRFFTPSRGMSQRLPNGNTLIADSQGERLLEVTRENELVWSCALPGFVHTGRRYSAAQVPFVKSSPRP
jgi:hypothetical protein